MLYIAVADGWYKGNLGWKGERNFFGDKRALLMQLKITYTDGSEELIYSDSDWFATNGPILMSEIYHGETFDARLDESSDTSSCERVSVLNYSKGNLVAQIDEPVRVIQEIYPEIQTPKGETVIDFGQNMVGWLKFTVRAARHTTVTL